jgi:hypothetical protein
MKTKKHIIKSIAIAAIAVVATLGSSTKAQATAPSVPTWEQVSYYYGRYQESVFYAATPTYPASSAYANAAALGYVYYAPYEAYYSAFAGEMADPYYDQGSIDYAYYTFLANYYAALTPASAEYLLNYFSYTAQTNSDYLYGVGWYVYSYYQESASYLRNFIFPTSSSVI